MKKLLGILVLGLLWCNISFAKENISGFSKILKSNMIGKVDRMKAVKKSDGYPVYEGKTSIQVIVDSCGILLDDKAPCIVLDDGSSS